MCTPSWHNSLDHVRYWPLTSKNAGGSEKLEIYLPSPCVHLYWSCMSYVFAEVMLYNHNCPTIGDMVLHLQGSDGVEGVLNILKDELRITMQLAGMPLIQQPCIYILYGQFPVMILLLIIGCMRHVWMYKAVLLFRCMCIGCVSLSDIEKDMVVHNSYYNRTFN